MTMWLEQAWEHATALFAVGLPSIPLCSPRANGSCSADWHGKPCGGPDGKQSGKRPLPSGYPKLATSIPSAIELFNGYFGSFTSILMNLGIVIPDGIIAIEGDTPEADAEIEKLMSGVVTATRSARPGRGRAWLVKLPDTIQIASMTKLGASRAIDVRGPGGILVAPPSRHRTGYSYEWDVEPMLPTSIATAPTALVEFLERSWNDRIGRHLAVVALSAPAPAVRLGMSSPTPSPELYPLLVSVSMAPWASWAFPASGAATAAGTTSTGAVRSVQYRTRTLQSNTSPPPTPLQVLRSTLRKPAEDGWVDPSMLPRGRGFASRSELVHAILCAWIAAGIDLATAVETLLPLPPGDKAREQGNPRAWLAAEYARAYDAVVHEIEHASLVTAEWLNILPRTLDGGARARGMLWLIPPTGAKIEHEIVVTLGDPHDGERAGDFLEAARAFEPRVPVADRNKSRWSCAKRWQGHEALVVFNEHGDVRRLLPLEARAILVERNERGSAMNSHPAFSDEIER